MLCCKYMKLEQTPQDPFSEMMNMWNQIQVLGRNDIENSAGPQIINDVQKGNIPPEEGLVRMRALLESKQEH